MKHGFGWVSALAALWLVLGTNAAQACEEYFQHDMAELKEYRDKLVEADADPFDRMFAFQQLVCSSNPTMRSYAVREGMKNASDPIVRHQILLDAMMQMSRVDIKLTAPGNATKKDKDFVKSISGVWAFRVPFVSASAGCVSLYRRDRCDSSSSLFIRGGNVMFNYDNSIGEFVLTDTNELAGFVRINHGSDHGRIPATIVLN